MQGFSVLTDARYGARILFKKPAMAAIAVLSLALGIGASTVIFGLVYGAILNPFPYRDVHTLASVGLIEPNRMFPRIYHTADQILDILEQNSIFSNALASAFPLDMVWSRQGEPQRVGTTYTTSNTFTMFGVPPLMGRAIEASDLSPGAPPVCVLGYRFWQSQLGGDPAVLGSQLRINDVMRTVVGVMPRRFTWKRVDLYLPFTLERGQFIPSGIHLLGRLKPGVTGAHAAAELRSIFEVRQRKGDASTPGQITSKDWRVELIPFVDTYPGRIRQSLWILLGAVALLLVIGCGNVSAILLTKAVERQGEIVIRAVLGASWGRLVRQLLTESALLAVIGGVLGVALAFAGLKGVERVLAMAPRGIIPDEADLALHWPVHGFAVGISALAAVISGLAPALHSSATSLCSGLAARSRGSSAGTRHRRLRDCATVIEVALSFTLLAGAGLMWRTLLTRQNTDLGIRTDNVLTAQVVLNPKRYPDAQSRAAFFEQVLTRVSTIAGVVATALNNGVHPIPFTRLPVAVDGVEGQLSQSVIHLVNDEYTRTLGIPLVQGRLITKEEIARKRHIAFVNQAFVRSFLPGSDPLGRTVRVPRYLKPPYSVGDEPFQIVGVVKDTFSAIAGGVSPELYLPFTLTNQADRIAIRSSVPANSLATAIRRQVREVDPQQPVLEFRTIDSLVEDTFLAPPRFSFALFATLAGIALILTIMGVYGTFSEAATQRAREIGIRLAIGAPPSEIARIVAFGALKLIAAGITLGIAVSLWAFQLLKTQIPDVMPFDALALGSPAVVILLSGMLACLPAILRAAHTDAATTLRFE
ncbi:MAG: ABC transporter permease [Acidobacteria bacterium]|nr:ABC transporter permease [Acidobacteriota bacterium]